MASLKVEDISLSYDRKSIVISNFSLEAFSGDCVLLEGRNGKGKTTILKAISGLLEPVSGRITIDGFDVFSVPPSKRKSLVALAQQSPHYNTPIKVIEYLEMALPRQFSLLHPKRLKKYITILEIEDLLLKPLSILSEGQKKLALICRTFIQGSSVLLLDEPDAFLDTYNQKLVREGIKEVLNEGKIVVFVSHNESFYSNLYNKKVSIISSSVFQLEECSKVSL